MSVANCGAREPFAVSGFGLKSLIACAPPSAWSSAEPSWHLTSSDTTGCSSTCFISLEYEDDRQPR